MAKLSKQKKLIRDSIASGAVYKAEQAVEVLKNFSSKKFIESIDIAVNLGVDPRKSDQVVRSSTLLPK